MDRTLIELARDHRKNPTEAESVMWQLLRRHFNGWHFRRQYPVAGYIGDFACAKKKIIIEIDGGYHFSSEQQKEDEERTMVLNSFGFSVLRFTNEEVIANPDGVLQTIKNYIINMNCNE